MKILLATDGSRFSEAGTQFVASQFCAEGAEVLVLQVVEPLVFSTPPQMAPGYAPEMAERLRDGLKQAKEVVARTVETLRKAEFKEISVAQGKKIGTEILTTAAKGREILIVFGSQGQRGWRNSLW